MRNHRFPLRGPPSHVYASKSSRFGKVQKIVLAWVVWDSAQDTRCPRTHLGVLGRYFPRTLLCPGTQGGRPRQGPSQHAKRCASQGGGSLRWLCPGLQPATCNLAPPTIAPKIYQGGRPIHSWILPLYIRVGYITYPSLSGGRK